MYKFSLNTILHLYTALEESLSRCTSMFDTKKHTNVWRKIFIGDTRIWTMDLSDCSRLLYHWAISPYVENIVSSEERQVGVTCQNCQSPLAVETKSKCHHYRSINCISEHLKRRWYNGQHSCLPSSWSGFDSRPTQCFKFDFGQKWDQKVFVHAVTRIRTWVTAATTQGPNH